MRWIASELERVSGSAILDRALAIQDPTESIPIRTLPIPDQRPPIPDSISAIPNCGIASPGPIAALHDGRIAIQVRDRRQPAWRASVSLQNQRSPYCEEMRVCG